MKYPPKTQKILHLADAAICGALWEVKVSASSHKDVLRQNSGIPQQSNATLMPPKWPHMKPLSSSVCFFGFPSYFWTAKYLLNVIFFRIAYFESLKFCTQKSKEQKWSRFHCDLLTAD